MDTEIKEEFRITDDKTADWAVRKIAEERAEFERLKSLACAQIDEISERIEEAKKRLDSNTDYLKTKLAEYFGSVPHRKTKTSEKYRLLSGTLTLKLGGAKPKPDSEKLVQWLAANGYTDYIKTEQSPQWGEFKKLLDCSGGVPVIKETGEVVEGVELVEALDEFEIDTK